MAEPFSNPPLDDSSLRASGLRTARAQIEAARHRERELIASGRLTANRFASSPLSDRTLAGFTLIREIHRGGQGVVYEALQQTTNRKVAIKVLLDGAHASNSARQRFEREIELVAGLRHPNLISVFHSDQTSDGLRYCVMDYVCGRPLTRHVRAAGLTLDETLLLFAKVCDAVNHAHQKGVIHRDLKPSNILVDDEGEPKVLDFGLAKVVGGQTKSLVSVTGQFVGTLQYMSPEQARGHADEIDIRSDVYSLGVLLYEMLTGQYPYPVMGAMADGLRHIAETRPTPPSRRGWQGAISARRDRSETINDEIDTIVLKALAKDRDRRYQSAGELSRDIHHYLAGEPIESKRDSAFYVIRKQLRRHRVAVGVGLGFLVLLVAGLATSLMFAFKAERALDAVSHERARAEVISTFLKDMLTAADPAKARGAKLTVVEALDKAVKRIEAGSVTDQPLVEAEIRFTIGSTYWSLLGPSSEAEAQFRAAAAIQARELGDEHVDTLRTRFHLARTLIRTNAAGAAALAEPTMLAQSRLLGSNHVDTLRSMVLLGVARAWSGRFADGESLLRAAIERRERSLGRDHVDTAYFLNRLGDIYSEYTYPEKAEPFHREALRIYALALGDDHPDTISSKHALAQSLCNQNRPEEAEINCREALEPSSRVLGKDHPETLALKADLAFAYYKQGRLVEAELLYRETLAAQVRILGSGDYDTVTTQRLLAGCLAQLKRYAEAETLLREALAVACAKFGPEDGGTSIRAMCTLANVLVEQGKEDEAEQVARKVIQYQQRQKPRPHPAELAESSSALIEVLRRRGACQDARSVEQALIMSWLNAASAPEASADILNSAARALLHPVDATLRNAPKAMELARRANEIGKFRIPRHLDTLATAHFLTGDSAGAVKLERTVLELLQPTDPRRSQYEARLIEFKTNIKKMGCEVESP